MNIYTKLRDLLHEAGLGETEVETYIEILKKPAETIWELVTRTGFSKSVIYRSFEKLKKLKMVEKEGNVIRACSLKVLVAELVKSERKLRRVAHLIKNIAPFLRAPRESIDELETFYTQDQIADTYVDMSLQDFDVSLDFGDFEHYVPVVGGINPVHKFRVNRLKHATNHAVCTSYGPYTALFCTPEAKTIFKNTVDIVNTDFKGNFIVFSDRNDYVMFNNFTDPENPTAVLVKSKTIADMQRANLKSFPSIAGIFHHSSFLKNTKIRRPTSKFDAYFSCRIMRLRFYGIPPKNMQGM